MGRENSAKTRQHQELERKKQRGRAACERILIVSEGSKTEPLYFDEIRIGLRLPVRNVTVSPGVLGTEPIQVVQYAKNLFENGDLNKGVEPRAFDRIYAVFDRDDHRTYFDALRLAESLDRKLKNDDKKLVPFKAVASVPSFELWLLLHYEDIQSPLHRDEVMHRLKQHIPGYEKGAGKAFATTSEHLAVATQRAERLAARFTPETAPEPFTAIAGLVALLTTLRS
ncbi:RloB family protein [Pseudomonas sp.]|uniref:RloB family protein n=1 Tax=Pseudomonas sp. TaxID=306 RepID=UPI004053FF57